MTRGDERTGKCLAADTASPTSTSVISLPGWLSWSLLAPWWAGEVAAACGICPVLITGSPDEGWGPRLEWTRLANTRAWISGETFPAGRRVRGVMWCLGVGCPLGLGVALGLGSPQGEVAILTAWCLSLGPPPASHRLSWVSQDH